MRSIADEIRQGHRLPAPLGSLVTSSFRACAKRSQENADETRRLFRQLMCNLSVPWPEVPPRDVDPFEVHLNLCVRWNMTLRFDVQLLASNPIGGRKTVYIGPSVYAKFWASQYRLMHSASAVQRYIVHYLAYFYDDNACSKADIIDYNAVFNFTKRVVFLLANVYKGPASTFFTFDSTAKALGQPTDRSLSLINGHFYPEVMFLHEHIVIEKKRGTTATSRNIVANHDPTVVLSHLGWRCSRYTHP
ncbi:hypothetical protein V5799_025430 [Amblyomma americanum]|uniref:Uncharacterized protein n=1 Tax=Amblyomma americanum TaxID=6943 RepID=A0AAQ4E9K8_AMBAM